MLREQKILREPNLVHWEAVSLVEYSVQQKINYTGWTQWAGVLP
jgi:hypothetical protein